MRQVFEKLVRWCLKEGVSDMHLTGGHPVVVRMSKRVVFKRDTVLKPQDIDRLVADLLTPHQLEILRRQWSVDMALSVAGCRLRLNVFVTSRGLSLAIRFLPGQIPTLEQLNLHPGLGELSSLTSGLVLLCGATGSGKTTTIAAILNAINENRNLHVVTLEDPIEFRFESKKSFFEQRELGSHFPSFEQGLEDVLREAPDVVFVGELRDPQTMRLTLNAAASGHLVFATLHASDAEEALHRIFNSFPLGSQSYIRYHVAASIKALIVQQLTGDAGHGFCLPELSILRVTPAVKSAIRDNRLSQLENIIEMGRENGMYSFERYREEFLRSRAKFHPPGEIFRAMKQNDFFDNHYVSPLVDRDAQIKSAKAGMPDAAGLPAESCSSLQENVDEYIKRLTIRGDNGD